jgi:hypothetical protein
LSVPPDSAVTHEVFGLEVSTGEPAHHVQVVRFREVNGVLGQRAIVVPNIAMPAEGDAILNVDDTIVVALPEAPDRTGHRFGTLMRFDRTGGSAGYRLGTPVLAWGAGRPTALIRLGETLGVAGLSPGSLTLATLRGNMTTPVSVPAADRLAAMGGVRAIVQRDDRVLLVTGDGSLDLGGVDTTGQVTSLQRVDTGPVLVTGLNAAPDGGVIATAVVPSSTGAPDGRVYRLVPTGDPAASAGRATAAPLSSIP